MAELHQAAHFPCILSLTRKTDTAVTFNTFGELVCLPCIARLVVKVGPG